MNILQIAFSAGVRTQISKDFRAWEEVSRFRVANTLARELRFMFQLSFGPAAAQFVNPGTSNRAFPASQQSTVSENTAKLKELDVTVEIEHSLWERAAKSPEKYAEPLALEMEGKLTAAKRLIASMFYGDGSGTICQVAAAGVTDTTGAAPSVAVTVGDLEASRGFIGTVQLGDLLNSYTAANPPVEVVPSAAGPVNLPNFYAWRVKSRSRRTGIMVLEPIDNGGALLTAMSASNLVATNVFHRVGQKSISDIPNVMAAVADYGSLSSVFAGLETLTANDGRVVHGISMAGASAGTRLDNAGAVIDVDAVHSLMDEVKVNVGSSSYSWKKALCSPEAAKAFITSRETDRRFISIDDVTRGAKKFVYQHFDDSIELVMDEFIKKQRMFILPENKAGDGKVLEWWGTDFSTVKGMGMGDFHLKPAASGGGYVNMMVSYLRSYQTLICKHPASIGVLQNFAVS